MVHIALAETTTKPPANTSVNVGIVPSGSSIQLPLIFCFAHLMIYRNSFKMCFQMVRWLVKQTSLFTTDNIHLRLNQIFSATILFSELWKKNRKNQKLWQKMEKKQNLTKKPRKKQKNPRKTESLDSLYIYIYF